MKITYKNTVRWTVRVLAINVGVLLTMNIFPSTKFSTSDLSTSVINRTNIITLTNESRKSQRLKILKNSKKLDEAAQKKADDMVKNQYFDHVSPAGKKAWDFMEEVRYPYFYAGENLAINFDSAQSVTNGWMMSPGHRANILNNDYTEIGIGTAHGKFRGIETIFVVQMFGKQLKSYKYNPLLGATSLLGSGTEVGKSVFVQKSLREIYGPDGNG